MAVSDARTVADTAYRSINPAGGEFNADGSTYGRVSLGEIFYGSPSSGLAQ
jgi:hypothetical protein